MNAVTLIYAIILIIAAHYLWISLMTVFDNFVFKVQYKLRQRKIETELDHVSRDVLELKKGQLRLDLLELAAIMEETIMEKFTNKKTLTELLQVTATEEDYKVFVKELLPLLDKLYKDYEFQLLKPTPDDFQSGYALGFQLFRMEMEETYDKLFRMAIDRGMTDAGITKEFLRAVKDGEFIDLGDAIISEVGTGVSTILTGEDLRIYVTFMTPEYKSKKDEHEAKIKEDLDKKKAEQEEYTEQRNKTYAALVDATDVLTSLTESVKEQIPGAPIEELEEEYELVRDLYGKV